MEDPGVGLLACAQGQSGGEGGEERADEQQSWGARDEAGSDAGGEWGGAEGGGAHGKGGGVGLRCSGELTFAYSVFLCKIEVNFCKAA